MSSNNLYLSTSPYNQTGIVNENFLDIMVDRPIIKDPSDIYWTVTPTYEFRPDLLAFDMYADPRLWWVFASRNPNSLKDPLFDFKVGLGIYLPKSEMLKQVLGF